MSTVSRVLEGIGDGVVLAIAGIVIGIPFLLALSALSHL